MATTQQAIAYKANAARSTGPKTGGGKARVGGNALKHGLQSSIRLLLHGEDPPKVLDALGDALSDELRPSTALQRILFNLIVSKFWRLMRISRIETDILQSEVIEERYQFIPSYGPAGIDEPGTSAVLGRAFQRRVRDREQLAHVQKYETSLERIRDYHWGNMTSCKRGRRCKGRCCWLRRSEDVERALKVGPMRMLVFQCL